MEYKWNKKEILKRLKQAIEEDYSNNIENYKIMLDIINHNVDLHDMDTVKADDDLTYGEHKELYLRDLQYIDDGIFDYVSSMFSIEKDIDNLFKIYRYDPLDLNNKELLDLGYGIIEQLNDKRVIDLYTQFRNNKTHRLNIDNLSSDQKGLTRDLQGITMYDYRNKRSYISIHREHNAEDVVTLLHEFMHALSAIDNKYDALKYGYFTELEGHFGERLAIEYMNKHDMKKHALQLEANNIYKYLNYSLMLYLNDLLFATSKNSQFRFREATKIAREETGYDDIIVRKQDIPEVCSYNGFDLVTNLIDYLIVLELNNTCDIEEQYRMIQELKKQDDFLFYNMAMPDMFKFFHDEVKDFKKLKKSIDKKTRVIL